MTQIKQNVCPVNCGLCCTKFWKQVFTHPPADADVCPNLSTTGCRLPVAQRPAKCLDFLCCMAAQTLEGHLSVDDAKAVAARKLQFEYCDWNPETARKCLSKP